MKRFPSQNNVNQISKKVSSGNCFLLLLLLNIKQENFVQIEVFPWYQVERKTAKVGHLRKMEL